MTFKEKLERLFDDKLIDKDKGHLAAGKTADDVARKFGVDIDDVEKELEMGIKAEKEHTNDEDEARQIALDHLYGEFPDYYTRLKTMEIQGKKATKR